MYLITNRALSADSGGLDIFGSLPNEDGVNNLRVVEVTGSGRRARAKVLKDELSKTRVRALKRAYELSLDEEETQYRSLELACALFSQACDEEKHILFYVHGYNNDVADIVDTAYRIERQYKDVIVAPFTWPARGGGVLSGTANYIDDKRDARASSQALDRVIEITRRLHILLTSSRSQALFERAMARHENNPEAARVAFVGGSGASMQGNDQSTLSLDGQLRAEIRDGAEQFAHTFARL